MKAYDIYKKTLALMFEREDEDKAFKRNFCALLSSVAAESLVYENSIRYADGREQIKKAPEITDMEQELPFSDSICAVALPYGVAAYFAQDDGEEKQSEMYRSRFMNALYEAKKYSFEEIEDFYGGENL